jgi:hypothetical protein
MPKKRPVLASNVVRAHRGHAQRRKRRCQAQSSEPRYHLTPRETDERDIAAWLGWFHRFHTSPTGLYVPIALRTVDCPVSTEGQPAVLHRCVREVARFNGKGGVTWSVITWVPGLQAMQFEPCESEQSAMSRLESPAQPVRFVAMEHAIQGGQ